MTENDPLARLREQILITSPRRRRILALALRESDQDILVALAIGLIAANAQDEHLLDELAKLNREEIDKIAATLPPPPAPEGIPRTCDPDTGEFRSDE